jgi:16S rRNA (cytosine967-C5)-methyltransferase
MLEAQRLAAQAVAKVEAGRNLNQVLDELRRANPKLTPQQRGALQDLSYTTLRWLARLEAILANLLQKPLTDERVRYLLLVALGQLEYGKSAPHAVVDHAVRVAAQFKQSWAGGLVNAVLRNFLRQREALVVAADKNVSTRLSYQKWWINKLRAQYPEAWEAVLSVGNGHPPMTLRVNLCKISRDDYLVQLEVRGVHASAVGVAGIRLDKPVPVDKLPGFADGLVSVQDLGAQLAAPLLDVQDGMRVLDACSAPGGKSAHLLELAKIELLALDSDASRLNKVRDNLQRLGLAAIVSEANAARSDLWWDGRPFDRILADVPCSASGIVRRHPDIKWLRREADLGSFVEQQANILQGLWSTLAKGGKLLYATCSVFHEENDQQVEAFIANTPDARRLPLPGEEQGQLLPCDAHDGFFYALLQKI